jgi:predicted nuclease of restriction endonuclease-like (RecB) superfamily
MGGKRKTKRFESEIVQQSLAQLIKTPTGYAELLEDLKMRIRSAQIRAGLAANRELILLNWEVGKQILNRQQKEGWGSKVIDRLSRDLHLEFPEIKGFSPRNLKYMRAFACAYPDQSFVQEVLAQIPWYHNITLYKLTETLPKSLKGNLPSIEELEISLSASFSVSISISATFTESKGDPGDD